jgi:putative phosphoesterase
MPLRSQGLAKARWCLSDLKIAAVSDLHVLPDTTDDKLLQEIHQRVEEIEPNFFVIAGDISDRATVLERSLDLLHAKGAVNLFVPGNHDIWFEENGGAGSQEKYSHILGEVCKRTGFHYLPNEPHISDDTAFIGTIGWYDYSFRREDMGIAIEDYEGKEHRGAVWYDLFRVDWRFTDREATELFNKKIKYDIDSLPDTVTRIVYVSHHLPFRELTVYKNRFPWDFHSAFMGATSTGQILEEEERVILSISGHSHIRSSIRTNGLTAMTVPLGYGRPSADGMSEFVRAAVAEIRIDGESVALPGFVEGDICKGLGYVAPRR